jgi:hypothetical protein
VNLWLIDALLVDYGTHKQKVFREDA